MLASILIVGGCMAAARAGDKSVKQDGSTLKAQTVQQDGGINIAYAVAGGGTLALAMWLSATYVTARLNSHTTIETKKIDAELDKMELEVHEKVIATVAERK